MSADDLREFRHKLKQVVAQLTMSHISNTTRLVVLVPSCRAYTVLLPLKAWRGLASLEIKGSHTEAAGMFREEKDRGSMDPFLVS